MGALGLRLAVAWGLSHGRVIVHPGAILHRCPWLHHSLWNE